MKIEQIYTGCLAQGAYYIVSNGEAAIIDPLREVQPYLDRLEKDGVKLKYIFETHFHADFVSGHLDLSKKTGAPVIYGPTANACFECMVATDGQIFELGDVKIKLLHTPGHTMESATFLLIDEQGNNHCIFSGDTLFLGDVGRPDLAQKAANMTQEELAGLLYDSIYQKIIPLEDYVIVYPGHGAGSACGKNMMKETVDTLGNQKKVNYALKQPDKNSFIKAVTEGLQPPPGYFGMNVAMNKGGYQDFDSVLKRELNAIDVDAFGTVAEVIDAIILDTRNQNEFALGFIPGSINIGLSGDFAPWVGALIVDVNQPIMLVTEEGKEQESITRLSRIGFDNVQGFLKGGYKAWAAAGKEVDAINRISAIQFEQQFDVTKSKVIDVRRVSEYDASHVSNAINKPLDYINEWIVEINPNEHFYLHCAGGYRSMIAASILYARGYRNFTEIEGGITAISTTNIPCTEFVCSSKMNVTI